MLCHSFNQHLLQIRFFSSLNLGHSTHCFIPPPNVCFAAGTEPKSGRSRELIFVHMIKRDQASRQFSMPDCAIWTLFFFFVFFFFGGAKTQQHLLHLLFSFSFSSFLLAVVIKFNFAFLVIVCNHAVFQTLNLDMFWFEFLEV